jgi:hypothetical protein
LDRSAEEAEMCRKLQVNGPPMEIIQMVSLSSKVAGFLKRIYTQAREAVARGGYRPEKHYMRGPGPKAKAKHQSASAPQSR